MSPSASSTARSSSTARRPADRPRRCGSTTVVCSRVRASHVRPAQSSAGSSRGAHLRTLARRASCSGRETHRPARRPRSGRRAARGLAHLEATAGERARRGPPQSGGRGARSASCSRTIRISSRSPSSAARRRTSARSAERTRLRAAAPAALCVPPPSWSSPRRGSPRAPRPRRRRDERATNVACPNRGTNHATRLAPVHKIL